MSQVKNKCFVCEWNHQDEVLFGEWKTLSNIEVHYFCLLSGVEILQRGTDNGGILGFLRRDIIDSKEIYQSRECFYCEKLSAAVTCAHEGCDRAWHYPCGTRNSCMTRFSNSFESFCNRHVPDNTYGTGKRHDPYQFCSVCYEMLGSTHHADFIISPCCINSPQWDLCFVHKNCVMKYTKNAGYDSMCITCPMDENFTKKKWQEAMRQLGIYVPMAEASWERNQEFKDHVKNKCGDPQCPTPNSTRHVWTCFVCGCFPRHLQCAGVEAPEDYCCPNCFDQSFVQRVPRPSSSKF